jgi:hypothetical protein
MAAAQPTPGLQRPGEALHHGRQRRRLSRLSNRRAVLGRRLISIRAAGENACMEGGDGFLCMGLDFYVIRFRSPKP